MLGRAAVLFLLPMLLATGSLAQKPPVATSADPRPQEQHDTTTPKGALKALAAALRDGDGERIRQVMAAANPAETRMVAAMADMARAMADLQKAAVKAFGPEGAKEVVGDTHATDAAGRARIDAAEVRVQGDTATVVVSEGEDTPVVLRKVGGQWKVPMAELSKNADPNVLDERLDELAEQRKLVAQLTKEIGDGEFNSPTQAKDAWQSRAMQAVTRRPPTRKPQPEPKSQQESSAPTGDATARPASGR
jgi:hypothetical protein